MRKSILLWSVVCLSLTTSCSKDENETQNNSGTKDSTEVTPSIDITGLIVGEWITEKHTIQREVGIHCWEILNFSSADQAIINGKYEEYTAGELTAEEINDNVTVNCKVDGNNISMTTPSGNINRSLKVSNISELSLQVTEGTNTSVSYSKLLSTKLEIDKESLSPDYKSMLPRNVEIKGFTVNNSNVVNVDARTGLLTAVASGSAYLYVETNKGTVAVKVVVKRMIETDYAALIGKEKTDVIAVMGSAYIEPSNGKIVYNPDEPLKYDNYYLRNTGNWVNRVVNFDGSGYVTSVVLNARKDIWFTNTEMINYLSQYYKAYGKASNETKKVFLNASMLKDATIRIIWDMEEHRLTFTQNSNNIIIAQEEFLPDYSGLFGDLDVISYRSENEYIAKVDETGKITGIDSGNTNIVVIASQGTFILPVKVCIFFAKDYEGLLGGKRADIVNLYNVVPNSYSDDDSYDQILKFNSISFPQQQRETGNWETIKFKMNNAWIGPITEVLLTARQEIWFTDAQMIAFLKDKYVYDEKNSTETIYFFVNNKEEDLVSISIVWNITNHTLKFANYSYF